MSIQRREFIKQSCMLCASLVGISIVAGSLEGCAPLNYYKPVIENDTFTVPKSSFIEGSKLVIIKESNLEYNIALVKINDIQFRAFELKCTHQDNALIATESGFHCSLHGSSFDITGKVKTSPATANLKEFSVKNEGDNLLINLKA